MKLTVLLALLTTFTAAPALAQEDAKLRLLSQIPANAEIKVYFNNRILIPIRQAHVQFSGANEAQCYIQMRSVSEDERVIESSTVKDLKVMSGSYLEIVGASQIHLINCGNQGEGLSLKNIEESSGGAIAFTIKLQPPTPVTE